MTGTSASPNPIAATVRKKARMSATPNTIRVGSRCITHFLLTRSILKRGMAQPDIYARNVSQMGQANGCPTNIMLGPIGDKHGSHKLYQRCTSSRTAIRFGRSSWYVDIESASKRVVAAGLNERPKSKAACPRESRSQPRSDFNAFGNGCGRAALRLRVTFRRRDNSP